MNLSDALDHQKTRPVSSPSPHHTNAAFLVEVLVLFGFFLACSAIFVQILVRVTTLSASDLRLEEAMHLATNQAETFSADPTGSEGTTQSGDYQVTCDVTPEQTDQGTLYQADITVTDESGEAWNLTTSRYVSGGVAQ
ncbi:MAG: hypothetical protein PHR15_06080 [Atopobiaceae bacterium]|jgi:hypothetical protein|nr:hypothetical protein [Atopobiaceae bacterium]MCH4180726.1 hypothetical protein [Atopobiaceae bacterium]MCH4215050.1 hypothetical protein [Atopobiaceae bacterium]MCH4230677.1 hypothetical protein [Atopobiaceae bacterium]MCH4277220.1 hypothetical protein [Atopobiaceae bacterium]